MLRTALNRLGVSLLVMLAVSIIAFGLLRLSGDLAVEYAGENASASELARVRAELGLDRTLQAQYADWAGAALRGDFGRSLYTNEPVGRMLIDGLAVTGRLAILSMMLALIFSLPLGMMAARSPGSLIDRLVFGVIAIGQGIPSFLLAIILLSLFAVRLGWLPASGSETLAHYALPTVTMAFAIAPALMRVVRTSTIDVLSSEYIETARGKQIGAARLLAVHALPNACLPMIGLVSVQFGQLLAGSVVVEQVFALDGVGRLALSSIERLDFRVVQAIVLCLGAVYVVLTLIADIAVMLIDPRLRRP